MKEAETGHTQLSTPAGRFSSSPAAVPCLTILAHSDARRVGERLALPALAAGGEIPLSRLAPVFRAAGEPVGEAQGRPLGERHLSRQPVRLRPGEEPGSVVFDRAASRTRIVADGRPLGERLAFSAAELRRGVVLELGTRVVVLLHRVHAPAAEKLPTFGLVGDSDAVVQLRREIRRLAPLDVPVLLRGETGTGKELVARALHQAGPRSRRPWVTVNMGALPPTLAAAELFGAERGAYTGADRRKPGMFERAHGGTLFLDEIGETPLEVQVSLLRSLESGEIRPVGSTDTQQVDLRVVAATDVDLDAAIRAGRFRAQLYHRLAGYSLRLPALRDHRDDVGRLFYHFLAEETEKLGTSPWSGDEETSWPPAGLVARLARHDWPGNVRELRNVARRLAILGPYTSPEVLAAQIEELLVVPAAPVPAPSAASEPAPAIPARRRLRKPEEVGDEELLSTLKAHQWKLQPAAQALGLSRINLYRRIEECPAVRTAAALGREEIEDAMARSGGDLEAAAAVLEVSLQGLKRRITALGLARR